MREVEKASRFNAKENKIAAGAHSIQCVERRAIQTEGTTGVCISATCKDLGTARELVETSARDDGLHADRAEEFSARITAVLAR